MRRRIVALVEDPLTDFVLARDSVAGASVVIDCTGAELTVREAAGQDLTAIEAGQGKLLSFDVEQMLQRVPQVLPAGLPKS